MYLELCPHVQIFHVVFPRDQYWDPLIFDVNDISSAVSNKLLLYTDDYAILVADRCLSNIEMSYRMNLRL